MRKLKAKLIHETGLRVIYSYLRCEFPSTRGPRARLGCFFQSWAGGPAGASAAKRLCERIGERIRGSVSQHVLLRNLQDQNAAGRCASPRPHWPGGRGFDPCLLDTLLGLIAIRERAKYIGGRLAIKNSPGQGSRFTLTVPFAWTKARQGSIEKQCPLAPPIPTPMRF